MKKVLVLLLLATLTLTIGSCKKENNNDDDGGGGGSLTDRQKLTSKSWTSYKIMNGGTDVTPSASSITFNFHDNNTYTATGLSGSGSSTWDLSGTTLNLGSEGSWTVVKLTTAELWLDYSNGAIEVYLN